MPRDGAAEGPNREYLDRFFHSALVLCKGLGPMIQLLLRMGGMAHVDGRFVQPRMAEVSSSVVEGQRLETGDDDANHAHATAQRLIRRQVHGVGVEPLAPKPFQ